MPGPSLSISVREGIITLILIRSHLEFVVESAQERWTYSLSRQIEPPTRLTADRGLRSTSQHQECPGTSPLLGSPGLAGQRALDELCHV